AGLKQRIRCCCDVALLIRETVGPSPVKLTVADHGNADGVDMELGHARCQRDGRVLLAVYQDRRNDGLLHRGDNWRRRGRNARRSCKTNGQENYFHPRLPAYICANGLYWF